MNTTRDSEIRVFLKQEISRLKEGALLPADVPDNMLLFDLNQDGSENLGLDSLDALEIAMAIERQLDISMPSQDINFEDFATVDRIVAYLCRR
ncbi:MAG: acyl carrier protein [Dehalococcoidia bacterium]